MNVIHKARKPKHEYVDPTWCYAYSNSRKPNADYLAKIYSRIRWTNVTCKKCLELRGKR